MTKIDLFISCGGGLEPLLVQELSSLGYPEGKEGFRGVYLNQVSKEAIYRINYCSRIASRVLLPLISFRCEGRASLYRAALEIDWTSFFTPGKTFAIDANVHHPALTNSLFAAQVLKDAICDQMRDKTGRRPSVNVKEPHVQLNLFVQDSTGIISFDTSGMPLHKRGYRLDSVEAPIQESLAAALLQLAGYQGEEILCDPCCGSGTFLIEAALIATATPPGYLRTQWGFMGLPDFSPLEWVKIKGAADRHRKALLPKRFFGMEISRANSGAAKRNIRAAGFQGIEVIQGDFRDLEPPIPPNFIIANPPHGKRLQDEATLKNLYRALGDFMKRKSAKPGKGYIFTGSFDLSKEVGLQPSRRHVINNSGVDSRFLAFDLY